jgi:hypothetical protein
MEAPFVLPYEGNGLSLGECGVKISTAVDSDDGLWRCMMATAGGSEETATVSVTVKGLKTFLRSTLLIVFCDYRVPSCADFSIISNAGLISTLAFDGKFSRGVDIQESIFVRSITIIICNDNATFATCEIT